MLRAFGGAVGKRCILTSSSVLGRPVAAADVSFMTVCRPSSHSIPSQAVPRLSNNQTSGSLRWSSTQGKDDHVPSIEDLSEAYKAKAMRAEQLSRDLAKLMENQDQRLREEQSKGLVQRVGDFMKSSRSQMINIVAAFLCVVLAYQTALTRRYGRLLEQKVKEKERELDHRQALLRSLASDDFLASVAEQCAAQASTLSTRSGWMLSGLSRSVASSEKIAEAMLPILQKEVGIKVGDSILTDEEKKEKVVRELMTTQQGANTSRVAVVEDELQVELIEDESGTKVVKERVLSI